MSTVRNGTTRVSGTGTASEYNLMLSHLFIVFFLFLYRLSANINNPYTAIMLLIFTHSMIYFMIFGIKICCKTRKTLTNIKIKLDKYLKLGGSSVSDAADDGSMVVLPEEEVMTAFMQWALPRVPVVQRRQARVNCVISCEPPTDSVRISWSCRLRIHASL
jgi:hypothetical protein